MCYMYLWCDFSRLLQSMMLSSHDEWMFIIIQTLTPAKVQEYSFQLTEFSTLCNRNEIRLELRDSVKCP